MLATNVWLSSSVMSLCRLNALVTVFAVDFPMRVHVCLKLPPPLTCDFTLLTFEHTLIMLCLNVHP